MTYWNPQLDQMQNNLVSLLEQEGFEVVVQSFIDSSTLVVRRANLRWRNMDDYWSLEYIWKEASDTLALLRWGLYSEGGYVYGQHIQLALGIEGQYDRLTRMTPNTPEGRLLGCLHSLQDISIGDTTLRHVLFDDPWSEEAGLKLCRDFGLTPTQNTNAYSPWYSRFDGPPNEDVLSFFLHVPKFEALPFKIMTKERNQFETHEEMERHIGRYRRLRDLYITMQRSVR